jgi:hypothetical protein
VASFFDATNTAHTALIVRSVRTHTDLATEAAKAERDVIMFYTLRQAPNEMWNTYFYTGRGFPKGNGVYVCLEGFDSDADDVTDTELKDALRDTIADVLSWRLSRYGESPLLSSVSTAKGSSKVFHEYANGDFPPRDWNWRLSRWDLRPPTYTIG